MIPSKLIASAPIAAIATIRSRTQNCPSLVRVRLMMPFVYSMIVALFIITYFPETVLWLPRLMGYKG